jgi:hypothetical protein
MFMRHEHVLSFLSVYFQTASFVVPNKIFYFFYVCVFSLDIREIKKMRLDKYLAGAWFES